LLQADTVLPTGLHLVAANHGANSKTIPPWGFCRFTVCFSGQNFQFNFLLAAVATPLLGMDFVHIFGFSIIPATQQVLHAAPSPRQVLPLL
jgi:hypothetical protein